MGTERQGREQPLVCVTTGGVTFNMLWGKHRCPRFTHEDLNLGQSGQGLVP